MSQESVQPGEGLHATGRTASEFSATDSAGTDYGDPAGTAAAEQEIAGASGASGSGEPD